MYSEEYRAIVLGSELNLNKLAAHFGINRKFKWEDSLILRSEVLANVLSKTDDKLVFMYHFGGAVFVNFKDQEIVEVAKYLRTIDKTVTNTDIFQYVDDYSIDIVDEEALEITNDKLITQEKEVYQREIVSTVLAKSVALEKIEANIDELLDEVEEIVERLRRGNLSVEDETLANMSAKILGFKLNTISSIMLLDKPDITWENEKAAHLYDKLVRIFELNDRYENIRHKTEMLMDITDVFANLAHAKRGTKLEWAIILLIMFEIVLSLFDKFIK